MSTNLIQALVVQLEAAHRIASELARESQKTEKAELADALGSIFGVIRGGANRGDGGTTGPVEAAPTENPVKQEEAPVADQVADAPVADAAVDKTVDQKLIELLNDERFTLRTATSLIEESGFEGTGFDLFDYLEDDLNLAVVRKNRRSDNALLIGLADRN